MTGGRLAHLNLELGSRRDCVGPTAVLQRRDAKSGGFVDGFGGHLNRMPNAGRTGKADRARPKGPRRVQRIIFALSSPMFFEILPVTYHTAITVDWFTCTFVVW